MKLLAMEASQNSCYYQPRYQQIATDMAGKIEVKLAQSR